MPDSYPPNKGMITEAKRGLEWRREFGRGGTAVGIARARDISNAKDLPVETWRRIKAYFDRHQSDKSGQGWSPDQKGYPSNGRIAWALWGGDAGWTRATELVEAANKTKRSELMEQTETRNEAEGYPLTPRQLSQYDADEENVELFGKLDRGIGPDGAHYVEESPFAAEGLVCSSCVFFQGGNGCEIVDGPVSPGGICKRWIIPAALVTNPDADDLAPEPMDEAMAEPLRYAALEIENRKVAGREVEFRTIEVGGLELRDAQPDTGNVGTFRGYAAVFNSESEPLPFVETITPGAFKRSLNSGREVRMFMNHNQDAVLASTKSGTLRLTEDSRGLFVEADLPDTTTGRDLRVLMERGDVHSMSFGFSVPTGGETRSPDGMSRNLSQVILHEVSVVSGFPAYRGTEGASVRNIEPAADNSDSTPGRSVELARRYFDLAAKR
jgi:HK97 family phage prohead protease